MRSILVVLAVLVCGSVAFAQSAPPAGPPPASAPAVKKAQPAQQPQFVVNCSHVVLDVAVSADAGSSFTVEAPVELTGDCILVENPLDLTAKGVGAVVSYKGNMKLKGALVTVTEGEKGTKVLAETPEGTDPADAAKVDVEAGVDHTPTPMPQPAAPLPPPAAAAAPPAA